MDANDYRIPITLVEALANYTTPGERTGPIIDRVMQEIRHAFSVGMEEGLKAKHVTNALEGGRFGLSGDLTRRVVDELKHGRKIQAIKLVRAETQLGLKESKDLVERFPEF